MDRFRSFSESPAFEALSAETKAKFALRFPQYKSQVPTTLAGQRRDIVRPDPLSSRPSIQVPPFGTKSRHAATDVHLARARSKSHCGELGTRRQASIVKPVVIRPSSPFEWWHPQGSARTLPVTWKSSNGSEQSVTSSCLMSSARLSPTALKSQDSSPVISQTHIPDSSPLSHSSPVTTERTQLFHEQQVPLLRTPVRPSRSYTRSSSTEHAPRRLAGGDAPRQFLSIRKRTTPKGFKQLQTKPDVITPDRTPAYSLGDGFSAYEATPTGLPQVGSKRKFSRPMVPLGSLELTQSTITEPEQEQKRRKFTRTRKRGHEEDNSFDLADEQLGSTTKKRTQNKAQDDCEIPGSPLGRLASPILGETKATEEGQGGSPSRVAETQLLHNASDNAKQLGPCGTRREDSAAADRMALVTLGSEKRRQCEPSMNTHPDMQRNRPRKTSRGQKQNDEGRSTELRIKKQGKDEASTQSPEGATERRTGWDASPKGSTAQGTGPVLWRYDSLVHTTVG